MAWPNSQSRYVSITVAAADVASSEDDIILLLTQDNLPNEVLDSDISTAPQSDGGDIRFGTAADGGTQLPFHLVRYEQNATPASARVVIRVKLDLSSTVDNVIYMAWDTTGTTTAPAVGDANGRNAVYSGDGTDKYFAYYHMNEAANTTAGGYVDATGTSDATATESPGTLAEYGTPGTDRFIGEATILENNGTSTQESIESDASITHGIGTGDFAMGAWVRRDSDTGQNYQGYLSIGSFSPAAYVEVNTSVFGVFDGGVNAFDTDVTVSTWRRMTIARRSGTLYGYLNATQETTTHSYTDNVPSGTVTVGASDTTADARHMDGVVGDAWFFTGTWSANREQIYYDMESDPAAFVTAGTPANVGGAAAGTVLTQNRMQPHLVR